MSVHLEFQHTFLSVSACLHYFFLGFLCGWLYIDLLLMLMNSDTNSPVFLLLRSSAQGIANMLNTGCHIQALILPQQMNFPRGHFFPLVQFTQKLQRRVLDTSGAPTIYSVCTPVRWTAGAGSVMSQMLPHDHLTLGSLLADHSQSLEGFVLLITLAFLCLVMRWLFPEVSLTYFYWMSFL